MHDRRQETSASSSLIQHTFSSSYKGGGGVRILIFLLFFLNFCLGAGNGKEKKERKGFRKEKEKTNKR